MSEEGLLKREGKKFSHLPRCEPVDIEFQDLTYSVPQGRNGTKLLLRNINGQFRSGHLHAILGPSGAGKTTLLNVLAGYKSSDVSGAITVNGEPRIIKQFRRISRYIMQQDLLQPMLTVQESMMIAANLKLNREYSQEMKLNAIEEILDMLRLTSAKDTITDLLSGGERKRLSIALELLNNPPIIFLDEPTTGLDAVSSLLCVTLLKQLAEGGRTVICSVHAPSAKQFALYDNIYVIGSGECVYQGNVEDVIPFLNNVGPSCPVHFNPADFVIEVCSGDYGDFHDLMVSAIDNGRCMSYCGKNNNRLDNGKGVKTMNKSMSSSETYAPTTTDICPSYLRDYDTTSWQQFSILLRRTWTQQYRNKKYLGLQIVLYLFLGLMLGGFYINLGNDGSKTVFNFGYCYTCIIMFIYVPMMPVLTEFPIEVQLLKREYFNRWYGLMPYFCSLSMSTVPLQLILGVVTLLISYTMSDQPLEIDRFLMFFLICTLIAFISESLGMLVSSTLNVVNGVFIGPCIAVPIVILASYGFDRGRTVEGIPIIIEIATYFSYLRYALEALLYAIYGGNRAYMTCPEEEIFCPLADPAYFMDLIGKKDVIFWVDVLVLVGFLVVFKLAGYYLLRQRLTPNRTFAALQVLVRILKSHVNNVKL